MNLYPRQRKALMSLTMAGLGLLSACIAAPEPREPLPTDREPATRESDRLLVFLPGRGDRLHDFRRQGFFEAAGARGFDLIATDLHIGYYMQEINHRRLQEDVIAPAREEGYEEIWVVGISMGGLGAIMHAREYPGEVEGIILLAPYPGDAALVSEIRSAGALTDWDGDSSTGEDYQRQAWRWLRDQARGDHPEAVYLAYGESDRFVEGHRLLAAALPEGHSLSQRGGHRWSVWKGLWESLLEAGIPTTEATGDD